MKKFLGGIFIGVLLSFYSFRLIAAPKKRLCDSIVGSEQALFLQDEALRIIQAKCGSCHFDPLEEASDLTDFSQFPFYTREFKEDQLAILKDLLKRAVAPQYIKESLFEVPNKYRMPTLNAEQLTQEEIKTINRWYQALKSERSEAL